MTNVHSHIHYPIEEEKFTKFVDVRSKILATFIVILACSFLVNLKQLFWFMLIFLVFLVVFKPKKAFLKYSLATLPIILSLTLVSFLSFTSSLTVYRTIFYTTTHNNVSFSVFTGARSLLIVFFVLIMIYSEETFFEIIYGLDDLFLPNFLTNLTFLTYRFFFLMHEEFNRILEARSNRLYGQKLFFNLTSLRVMGNIIGSSLARSFKRAEYISATLSARGFSGKMSHPEQPWTITGVIFLLTVIVVIILLMVSNLSL
ncbi:MAG: energy-coupling factor transporter transmembrane protein EcfT [Candidatus Heimdallarchaeota archaeon]|nr:MAG: energy-coupling factor transporter transmembrane protein EcfT [Candidatus Heimdallarchaeota archaeon]